MTAATDGLSLRTRVAAETLRDWLHDYRLGGFDALYPKPRADRGQPRRLPPQAAAELLIALKTEHPAWPVRQVIEHANRSGHLPDRVRLAHSTVHRLLRAEGLMSKPAAADGADRRRFSFRRAGQLWMSDVMHGPAVAADRRRRRKSYLIAFLDDATRLCPSPPSPTPRTPPPSCRSSSRRSSAAGCRSASTSTTAPTVVSHNES